MEEGREGSEAAAESKHKFFVCTRHLMQLSCGKNLTDMKRRKRTVLIKAIVEQGLCSRRVKPGLQM